MIEKWSVWGQLTCGSNLWFDHNLQYKYVRGVILKMVHLNYCESALLEG